MGIAITIVMLFVTLTMVGMGMFALLSYVVIGMLTNSAERQAELDKYWNNKTKKLNTKSARKELPVAFRSQQYDVEIY